MSSPIRCGIRRCSAISACISASFAAGTAISPRPSYEDSARDLRGTSAALADVLEIADMLSMCKDSPALMRARLTNRKAATHLGLDADICQALIGESAEELAALRNSLGQ